MQIDHVGAKPGRLGMGLLFERVHECVDPQRNTLPLQLEHLIQDEGLGQTRESFQEVGEARRHQTATCTETGSVILSKRSATRSVPRRSIARQARSGGGPALSAATIASAMRGAASPSLSSLATWARPRRAMISARINCSRRGAVRGQMTSGLRAATVSTTLLYPPMETIRSAAATRLSIVVDERMTWTPATWLPSRSTSARSAGAISGPTTITASPWSRYRRLSQA